jgi:hypothetical protein
MAWNISLIKLPAHFVSVQDIPKAFAPEPLGLGADVLTALVDLFPDVDTADPTWVTLERPSYSIEFIIGRKEPIHSIGVRSHGDHNRALKEALYPLCGQTGWRAIDTADGEFLDWATE